SCLSEADLLVLVLWKQRVKRELEDHQHLPQPKKKRRRLGLLRQVSRTTQVSVSEWQDQEEGEGEEVDTVEETLSDYRVLPQSAPPDQEPEKRGEEIRSKDEAAVTDSMIATEKAIGEDEGGGGGGGEEQDEKGEQDDMMMDDGPETKYIEGTNVEDGDGGTEVAENIETDTRELTSDAGDRGMEIVETAADDHPAGDNQAGDDQAGDDSAGDD